MVDDFVQDWGEAMLGPLAEPLLSGTETGDDGHGGRSEGGGGAGLSELWPRLSRIREGMEDLEASRTKVDLARQIAVDQSNPESIAHALGKVWTEQYVCVRVFWFYVVSHVVCCDVLAGVVSGRWHERYVAV